MQYVLLIYQAEELRERWGDDERREVLAGHFAMREAAVAKGQYVTGQKLMPCSSSTTLARRGGRLEISDGRALTHNPAERSYLRERIAALG